MFLITQWMNMECAGILGPLQKSQQILSLTRYAIRFLSRLLFSFLLRFLYLFSNETSPSTSSKWNNLHFSCMISCEEKKKLYTLVAALAVILSKLKMSNSESKYSNGGESHSLFPWVSNQMYSPCSNSPQILWLHKLLTLPPPFYTPTSLMPLVHRGERIASIRQNF